MRKLKSKAKVPTKKRAGTPEVGIVFFVANKLLIDRTPVLQSEIYGDFRIHYRGHDAYWETLKETGAVPQDSEYVDYPRGRVAYDMRTGKYLVFLDRCILKKKSIVNKIMSELNLPTNLTKVDSDIHYRCPRCQR
jgi:hypothetical protein